MLTNSVKRSLSTTSRLFLAGVLISAVPAAGCSVLFSEATEQGAGTGSDAARDVADADPQEIDASPDRSDGNAARPDCGPLEAARVIDFSNILVDSDWEVINSDVITAGPDMAIDLALLEIGDTASIAHKTAVSFGEFAIDAVIDSMPEGGDSFVRFELEDIGGRADIIMTLYQDRIGGSMLDGDSIADQLRIAGRYHLRFVRTGDIVRLEHGVDGLNWNLLGEFPTSAPYSLRIAAGRESEFMSELDSNVVVSSIGQDCEL